MLDYTKVAANQIVSDFKKIAYFLGVVTQIFYIAYLIYAVAANTGIVWVNAALLVLSVAFFVFYVIIQNKKTKDKQKIKAEKSLNRTVTKIYKYCKLALRLYPLALSIYGMYGAAQSPSFLSVLLLCFTVICWAMQIIFELLIAVVTNRLTLLFDGVKADVTEITKPFVSAANFFKRMTGKEVKAPEEPNKNQLKLREKVEEYRAEREEEKEREKQEYAERKKREKAEKKERKAQEKRQAKEEKKALKSSVSVEKKLLRAARKKDDAKKRRNPRKKEKEADLTSDAAAELAPAAPKNKNRAKNKPKKGA